MKQRCVQAVEQAIGRPLRAAEDREISDNLRIAMRQLESQDPARFASLSDAERLTEAATVAAQRLVNDAALKQRRVALQILAHDRLNEMIETSPHGGLRALDRLMAFDSDQRSGVMSIEAQRRAIRTYGISRLSVALDENNGAGWRLFSNDEGVQAIAKEAHGQRSGMRTRRVSRRPFAILQNRIGNDSTVQVAMSAISRIGAYPTHTARSRSPRPAWINGLIL